MTKPDPLYYLRSILRQLQEYRDLQSDAVFGPTIGTEILADNIHWLECFIDATEPRASVYTKEGKQ
ncbi:MAG: hypothetical protein ABL932_14260 [Terricaulis sp.]